MVDENLQILKILSDVAETTFRTKKSSTSRIKAAGFSQEGETTLICEIVQPLDDTLHYITKEIAKVLHQIPIYNFFLSTQNGINIYDAAQLISIIKDINNFQSFGNLMSYAGFVPNSKNYNKKLHKLLQRISYKLIQKNPQYQFIYDIHKQRYRNEHSNYPEERINNMAKRIVIKKFLKNLYVSWHQINKDDF